MSHIGSDFRKRFQYETPCVHGSMWNIQALSIDDRFSEQKNIDVDDARSLLLDPLPSHCSFDVENSVEQLPGHFFGVEFNRAVQKPWLCGELNRFGLVKRRDCYHSPRLAR